MDGAANIGRIPSSPLQNTERTAPIKDREARRESAQQFEKHLDDGEEPQPETAEHKTSRKEPHPPPDEDSGNMLDVVA